MYVTQEIQRDDFNPRAPCGARRCCQRTRRGREPNFNPRAPCGARPWLKDGDSDAKAFQSTRPVWGATTDASAVIATINISIHAPRVGRDGQGAKSAEFGYDISIHAPRVGRDVGKPVGGKPVNGFQSTRPVWGATGDVHVRGLGQSISIHAPRVGRDAIALTSYSKAKTNFNPRAPCGARRSLSVIIKPSKGFQSTRPVWGATAFVVYANSIGEISIHAPRVGRDDSPSWLLLLPLQFQSTRPVWGATPERVYVVTSFIFQSTRPVWGATNAVNHRTVRPLFQSTRPVWGATVCTSRASGNTS